MHREVFAKMGELGFLGAPIWERWGGSGMDYISFGILCEEHLSRFLITWIEFVQSAPNRRRPMAYSEPTLTG